MDRISIKLKLEEMSNQELISIWEAFNCSPCNNGYWDDRFPYKPYLYDLLPFDFKYFKRLTKFHYVLMAMKLIEVVIGERKIIQELNSK